MAPEPNPNDCLAFPVSGFGLEKPSNSKNSKLGTRNSKLKLAAARPAGFLHVRGNFIPRSSRRLNIFQLDGLHFLVEFFVDGEGNPRFLEDFIICCWFIQNHAQGGPGSPTRSQVNPDRGKSLPVLKMLLQHLCSLIRNLKHSFLLQKFSSFTP